MGDSKLKIDEAIVSQFDFIAAAAEFSGEPVTVELHRNMNRNGPSVVAVGDANFTFLERLSILFLGRTMGRKKKADRSRVRVKAVSVKY